MPSSLITIRSSAGAAIAVTAVLLAAFAPAGIFSFGFHNDYWAWGFDASWCCGEHMEAPITAAIGRIIAAKLLTAQFLFIHTLDDLRLWRMITIATLALNAIYFLFLLRREAPTVCPAAAAAVTILVFLHKTMLLNVLWASNIVYFNVPILLALVGAHLLSMARERLERPAAAAAFAALALPPLIAALFTYQPTATFLIVPLLWGVLMRPPDLRDSILVAGMLALVLLAGFGLYVLIHRQFVLPGLPADITMTNYRWDLAPLPVRTALSRLLRFYLPNAGNGWTIWAAPGLGFALLAFIPLGLAVSALRHWQRGERAAALAESVAVGAVFALAALSILPNLVAEQFATSVRVLFVPGAALAIGFLWALSRLLAPSRIAVTFAAMAALAAGLACAGVATTAALAEKEHDAIGKELAALDRSKPLNILILRSGAPRQLLGLEVDESYRPLPPIVLIGDYFLGRRHRGEARFDLSIISTAPGQPPIFVEAGTMVIDLQAMAETETSQRPVAFGVIAGVLTATPPVNSQGPVNAFDGNLATFWEAWEELFPVTLRIDFPEPRTVRNYSFVSGLHDASLRMPTAWRLLGSRDGDVWHVLDQQSGVTWRDAEVQGFPSADLEPLKALRFEFTANGLPPSGTQGLRIYEIRLY